jgi:hypothetical protein
MDISGDVANVLVDNGLVALRWLGSEVAAVADSTAVGKAFFALGAEVSPDAFVDWAISVSRLRIRADVSGDAVAEISEFMLLARVAAEAVAECGDVG